MDYSKEKVKIIDAASMLRSQLPVNAQPFTEKTIKLNNANVDDWSNNVLSKLADDNMCVQADKVWDSWVAYEEGSSILHIEEFINYITRPTEKQIEYWVNFFREPIEIMHTYGIGMINRGWNILMEEARLRQALDKYEKIYSLSDDPVDWYKNFKKQFTKYKNPFFTSEEWPEIIAKVNSLLTIRVTPEN